MVEKAQMAQAVRNAAAEEHGWSVSDVKVSGFSRLDKGGCTFFSAAQPQQLGRPPVKYAVLPDGDVVSYARDGGAAKILLSCGRGAPAVWWAQVVSWMSTDVRGIPVDEHSPSGKRKIQAAGAQWHEPTLVSDAASTTLTYFTYDYELDEAFRTEARLANGELVVTSTPLSVAK